MQFTLSKMLIAIAMVALACAGLTMRTAGWADGIMTLSLLIYLVVAIRAVGLHGRDRANAITFSLVGAGYLLLISCNASDLRQSLAIKYPLVLLAKAFRVPIESPPADDSGIGNITDASFELYLHYYTSSFSFQPYDQESLQRFFMIGRCVWSWLLAWLAGWFCGLMWARREKWPDRLPAIR
jgi:hypothetical protein